MNINLKFEKEINLNEPGGLNVCIGMIDGRYVATVEVEDTPQSEITNERASLPASVHDACFHPALNLPKVKEALCGLFAAKGSDGLPLFHLQKQWYVVFKVLKEMDWLDSSTQAKQFRGWAGEVYGPRGRCTRGDFDAVNAYYKQYPSQQWTADSKVDRAYTEVAAWMWQHLARHEEDFLLAYLAHDL